MQHNMSQHNTLWQKALQHNETQHNALPHSACITTQHMTSQCTTTHHNVTHHNAMQCITTQCNVWLDCPLHIQDTMESADDLGYGYVLVRCKCFKNKLIFAKDKRNKTHKSQVRCEQLQHLPWTYKNAAHFPTSPAHNLSHCLEFTPFCLTGLTPGRHTPPGSWTQPDWQCRRPGRWQRKRPTLTP